MKAARSLSRRSSLVGLANRSLGLLESAGLVGQTPLDVESLYARARRETGLDHFGDTWFRGPLEMLVRALNTEARLNTLGRVSGVAQLVKILRDRLMAQHWFDRHPEILHRRLAPPIIVVGPMRSGTTRLHRLLATDERFSHLRFFETMNPVPPPGNAPGNRDGRILSARLVLELVHRLNPNTATIHPTGPRQPEEELGLLVSSFWGMKNEAQWRVPSYGRWTERHDATPAYRHMANLLRLVGWMRGEDEDKPWVLKTPQHMLDLPALLAVFPKARIVFTHRQPRAVVGSSCSLVWNQMIIHSDAVDPDFVGREWLRKTRVQIDRMRRARRHLPQDQRIDVRFDDVERDWRATMRRIYGFLDIDPVPALPRMAAYMDRSRRSLHRSQHRYALGDFGLTREDVDATFRSYSRDFGLEPEGSEPGPILVGEPDDDASRGPGAHPWPGRARVPVSAARR